MSLLNLEENLNTIIEYHSLVILLLDGSIRLGLMWRRVELGFDIGSDRHVNPYFVWHQEEQPFRQLMCRYYPVRSVDLLILLNEFSHYTGCQEKNINLTSRHNGLELLVKIGTDKYTFKAGGG
jgi:hypothetical protein